MCAASPAAASSHDKIHQVDEGRRYCSGVSRVLRSSVRCIRATYPCPTCLTQNPRAHSGNHMVTSVTLHVIITLTSCIGGLFEFPRRRKSNQHLPGHDILAEPGPPEKHAMCNCTTRAHSTLHELIAALYQYQSTSPDDSAWDHSALTSCSWSPQSQTHMLFNNMSRKASKCCCCCSEAIKVERDLIDSQHVHSKQTPEPLRHPFALLQ